MHTRRKEELNLMKLRKDISRLNSAVLQLLHKLYFDVYVSHRQVMSKEELEEMKDEERKDSLFACVQRWLENLPDLAEFPRKYERAIKEMVAKKRNSIKRNGNKDYEMEIKKLEEVCIRTVHCY